MIEGKSERKEMSRLLDLPVFHLAHSVVPVPHPALDNELIELPPPHTFS